MDNYSKLDHDGSEHVDPVPMAVPVGFRRPPTLAEQVQRLVRGEMSRRAELEGKESFEEANDFDVDDDQIIESPWEDRADNDERDGMVMASMGVHAPPPPKPPKNQTKAPARPPEASPPPPPPATPPHSTST